MQMKEGTPVEVARTGEETESEPSEEKVHIRVEASVRNKPK